MGILMFDDMTDKIFLEAKVDKVKNMNLYEECSQILSSQMARLSVLEGMSERRMTIFNEQKKALVQDLIEMKEKGELMKEKD